MSFRFPWRVCGLKPPVFGSTVGGFSIMVVVNQTSAGSFTRGLLGRTGREVMRLGVSASYGVPGDAVERAFERGVNYLYWGSMRRDPFGDALRRLRSHRDRFVLVIQSYTRVARLAAWSLERALRALSFDYTDVLLLGMWNDAVPPRILDAAKQLQARGLVRYLGVSTHNRLLVPQLAAANDFDVVHFRYSAAHPGAETDIFPHLCESHRPGLTAFTATSWGQLLGQARLQGVVGSGALPKGERVPTAADCYRFVMTRPEVDVCMTGPKDAAQMEHALKALELGPMTGDELAWMRRVGKAVARK
jgi:aryl-alcohol dehydrogenase-like predicted oxidoreductase